MLAPSKCPAELKERATRMAMEARRDVATRSGAYRRIGEQLGVVHPEALRYWVQRAEMDQGFGAGTTTDDATRLAELEREVRKLVRKESRPVCEFRAASCQPLRITVVVAAAFYTPASWSTRRILPLVSLLRSDSDHPRSARVCKSAG